MFEETISSELKIHLMGEFLFLLDGKPIAGLNADRPQSLLAFLLLHRHVPQSRQYLAFRLWPDSPEGQARTNLRNLLHTVRHSLPDANAFIFADGITIQWQTDVSCDLDVARFEAALQEAERSNSAKIIRDCLETAVSLYHGDLLPGNYDDWLIPIREKFHQQYLQALRKLVTLLEGQQEYRIAAHYCQQLLQLDPLDEVTAVHLMRLHALNGDRAAVRRIFQTLALTLQRELGIAPAPATQEAYSQLLAMETKQPFAIMIVESPQSRPRPLPIPPTPFIGREAELAEIAELLANPSCRLLTILGPGGMGKSRLVLQTAVGHQTIFADGIAYASLATLDSSELIIQALAEALNFTLASSPDPTSQLLNFLHQKEILLVLDNFEQLLDSVWVLAEILAQVSGAKILITSRQRLDLQEEWVFTVHGLPLPDECDDKGIEENSSVLLFLHNARRSRHSFMLTEANRAAIVRICHLVDGLPLGLELAASWVHSLSCAEIANEIERELDFLTVSTRNIAERHRSIRAVFDYSWQMLSLEEQQILKRLSLFDTSFSREIVEEVAGVSLVQLLSLVDKSLIHRTDKNRYHLPEFFRRFVAALSQEILEEENPVCLCSSNYCLTSYPQDQDITATGAFLPSFNSEPIFALAGGQS